MDWDKVEFKDEKRFLSNMFPCKIVFTENRFTEPFKEIFPPDEKVYLSSEHLYQALKSKDPNWFLCIRSIKKPTKIKTVARKLLSKSKDTPFQIRPDWDNVKLQAMEIVLYLKFSQNISLKEKLKHLKGEIVERNCWGDTFWGTVNGVGENHLGKLLMKIRKDIIDGKL